MSATSTATNSREPGRPLSARVRAFFTEEIWTVRVAGLPRGKAFLYRTSRVAYSTFCGFFANRLTVRAAALTYYSVLSIVPFLAFAFAVLKGFGAYDSFVHNIVRPWLQETFGGNPALLGSLVRILEFVDRTGVSTLGVIGLLMLVYTCVSLLSSVEEILNEVWGATARRSFLRQVTDYITLLVTTPLLVVAATTVVTAAQSSSAVLFLRRTLGLGDVIDFGLQFTSLAVVALAFFAVYTILPNVRTRPVSAAIGSVVAAVLWQAALVLYVRFQVGVSSYNALYSVLSAIPIFLVWTYVSWLVMLVGAQVAASHQNERVARQRFRARRADHALRETLAVVAAAYVARDFLSGRPPPTAAALAERVQVPALTMEDILETLVRAGILAQTASGRQTQYLPARDLGTIRIGDVRDALRRDAQAEEMRAEVERRVEPALLGVLHAAEEEAQHSSRNATLRDLATMIGPAEAAPAPPTRGSRAAAPVAAQRPALDAK